MMSTRWISLMPQPVPIQTLLFDLDGVLIDSEPVHARHWGEIFREAGYDHTAEEMGKFVGLKSESLVHWVRERNPDSAQSIQLETLMDEKRTRFIKALQDGTGAVAIAGVDAFLSAQRGRRRMGLVTSTRLKTVGLILMHFNWRNTFEVVVGGDHVSNAKPHPEPYLMAMQRLRGAPESCLVFEDSLPGIASARAAGLQVCALSTTHSKPDLLNAGAKWVIPDFTDQATLRLALGE